MRMFVATKETQGKRENDFCFADEGERVMFNVLAHTGETNDGNCGCARSLGGIRTYQATTTMKVVEWKGDLSNLEYIISRSLGEAGWFDPKWAQLVPDNISWLMARKIAENAARFPVGTVVEYRDEQFKERQTTAQETYHAIR